MEGIGLEVDESRRARLYSYTPQTGKTITPILIGPSRKNTKWIIEFMSVAVGVPSSDVNVVVHYNNDQFYVDALGSRRLVIDDVKVYNGFGGTVPVCGGGAFQRFNGVDPVAVVQPSMQKMELVYPEAVGVSIIEAAGGGLTGVLSEIKIAYFEINFQQ